MPFRECVSTNAPKYSEEAFISVSEQHAGRQGRSKEFYVFFFFGGGGIKEDEIINLGGAKIDFYHLLRKRIEVPRYWTSQGDQGPLRLIMQKICPLSGHLHTE